MFIHLWVFLCRVVLTTYDEWGAVVTKLNVPADWKGLFSLSLSLSLTHTPFWYTLAVYILDARILKRLTLTLSPVQSGRYIYC